MPVDSVRRDTIKAPIAPGPRTSTPEIRGRRVVWDRDAIFASGAFTLPELLAELPGVSVVHAGFIAAVSATSWYGEPGRVRVYLDGVELDALDPREGTARDLGVIQLWSLEEVAVERAAGELRVHLRSWRVQHTTAQTRTDITTGSENLNLYRGFFGKRMQNGGVVQVAAQQYSTTSVRSRGDGDGLGAFGRVGMARGRLTIDGVATRYGRTRTGTTRNVIAGTPSPDAIPGFKGRELAAYLRAAWGDPDSSGLWAQAIAATVQHIEDSSDDDASTPSTDLDTAVSQTQYVGSAGLTRWGARLSGTGRVRLQDGRRRLAASLRASWDGPWLSLGAFAEENGPDLTRRQDVSVRATPLSWFHLGASHSIHTPEDVATAGPARTTSRAETGLRVAGRWVSAGVVRRSASRLMGMPAFDASMVDVDVPEVSGVEGGLSGRVYGPISLDWRGIQWDAEGLYRPRIESHTTVRVSTSMLRRFPRGNFHLMASLSHDYRSAFDAPGPGSSTQRAEGAGIYSTMLEIRIGEAEIFWYNRNFNGTVYETAPGYLMPRMVQLYGLRWAFWN